MSTQRIASETRRAMDKALEALGESFGAIRTGRASSAMFAKVPVEYYGAQTPLEQLASFNIQERTVMITPFDRSSMGAIERALRDSELGVNPSNDGVSVRVVLPMMTSERRKEYVELAKTRAEEARVSVRGARRRAKEELSALKSEVGEDEVARAERELEAMTKNAVERVDKLLTAKEREISEV